MLSHFFERPARIREIRSSPSGPLIEGFADHLFQNGYAECAAVSDILRPPQLGHTPFFCRRRATHGRDRSHRNAAGESRSATPQVR